MTKLATSPDRGNFHIECEHKAVAEGKKSAEDAQEMIEYYKSWQDEDAKKEADPEWAKDNMEYDLRSCEWMVAKVRAREGYAQNLYAAMCNREFQRLDVMPILQDKTWSCTWRYAGGIVADMREEGDYIDWYCSGIKSGAGDEDLAKLSDEDLEKYRWMDKHFVGEGHVTDEIREDFFKLGWIPVNKTDDNI